MGGELGNCQAALMGGEPGGELGNCQAAKMGGKRGATHSPEVLEKCRKAGMLGKDYGIMGGRPRVECEISSAPRSALKGLVRPAKWEPQVGHQLNAVRYIREQLRTMRFGKFTKEEGVEEEWEELEVNDVEEQVWTEIRERGFGGNNV